jgi:gliding motility-associated-like protein
VRLNALSSFGCGGTIQKTITLTETNTDFTSPTNICLGQPIPFQNSSSAQPGATFWNFDDGTTSAQINPVKTFLTAGTYDVKMINFYNNCTDSATKTVVVEDKPAVDFIVNDSSSCQAPFTVQFTDITPGATSWLWDFGDGNTSTQQNPSHQYNQFGDYTVKLVSGTSLGCEDSIVKTGLIKVQETTVQFTPGGGCIPFTYTPQATIQTVDSIASYLWNFGDGGTSTLQNPSHIYNLAGSYDITLTVTTVGGCTRTATINNGVRTGTPPTVDFTGTPLDTCASEVISFAGQAITSPGAVVEWLWDFGDGGSSNQQNPTHIFDDIGALNVTLTVLNNGCPGSVTKVFRARPPIAKFLYKVNCTNRREVTFTNNSIIDATLPTTYSWKMGDALNTQFATPVPPPFTYPSTGTYNVTLTVTNGPCSYTVTKAIIITDELADFSITKNPLCKNEVFTLSAINSNDALVRDYSWTIGTNIIPGGTRSINYSLPDPGDYTVSLTINDINHCPSTKTIVDYIKVNGSVAKFGVAAGGCANKAVVFNDSSTTSTSIVNWEWNFGDGQSQTFTAPPFTHTYSQVGRYKVALKVTDAAGCTDKSLPIDLRITDPKVGFRADTFYCPGAPLPFVDTSSGAGLSFHWDFGDGSTSTVQHPQHSYPPGDANYTVKLKITDISGCEDSVTKVDYIKIRSPKAAFDIQDTTTICPPLRTSFTFKGTDYQSFSWDFGDGGGSTLQNPSHFYSDYGRYIPKLYLVGPGGCIDSAEASVSIYDPLAATQLNYGPVTRACNSLNVDFDIVIPPAFKFALFFGDGTVDSSQQTTLSHFYSRPSFNTPRLVIYDTISGCEVGINGQPRIEVLGAIPLFGKDKKEFCDQGLVTFRNFTTKNEPIISTVWDFGDNTTSNAEHPTHNYTQPGTYIVTLNVTTQSNCSRSFSDTIRVYRTPAPSIQGKDTICVNTAELFEGSVSVADTLTNWQWNFGNGQTSTQQNNTATFTTPGNYAIKLTATNKIGCSSDTTKNIYVVPLPTAVPVQDPLTIAVGIGANIVMTYAGDITSYNWIPTTRLSCTNCPSPFANPQKTTKYTVQVEDRHGCTNSGDITVIVVCGKDNFFVPNTFSPNGDGRNEVFYPKGTGLFRIKSMRVFNRWGEVVFEKKEFPANDPSAGWNGTYKGKPASPDAYIYTMEILCENNTVIPVKGNVTLLR